MRNKRIVQASDIIFTVVIVAAAIVLWFFASFHPPGDTVVFRQNGRIITELPLFVDTKYEIVGAYTNLFEIENGSISVVFTNCPNHQCARSGAVSSSGAGIVCAPNGVSAQIIGGEADVDAFTG